VTERPFPESLCHRCAAPPKYVRTERSVFIRCPLLPEKYPRQPVLECAMFRPAVLETPRLLLREMTPGDLDFLAALLGDPAVMRFYPKVYTRDEARGWLERMMARYQRDGHALWLAIDKARGEPIGQIGLLAQVVHDAVEPEIGYLVHRPFQRQGYAFEAAAAVRDWAFAHGHDHVISLIRPENEPSQAVARKLGMTPGPHVMHGGFDHVVWRRDR
jgi:[ribosomal protein S5]-alanine N-acetyltransferase